MSQAGGPTLGRRSNVRRATPPLILVLVVFAVSCSGGGSGQAATATATGTAPAGAISEPSPGTDTAPAARTDAGMADAPGNAGVLLFGGFEPPTFLPDVWGFAPEDGWTRVSPATEAISQPGEVFGYDIQSKRAVFVEEHGSTWAFDASTRAWEDRRPDESPPAHGARMAYDSESDRLIVFGGFRPSPRVFDDTWAYDYESNTWTKMDPPTRPPARSHFAMAYDEASDRVVIFGGVDEWDEPFGDTWAYDYDTDTWELLSRHGGPDPRGFTAMADDPTGDRVILFGGGDMGQEPQGDTWALDVGTGEWTELDPTPAPSPRARHAMATDAESGTIVLFGGGDGISAPTNETWVFDPATDTWGQVT